MIQYGPTNSINNFYKDPSNIDSNTNGVSLFTKLGQLDSANTNYINATGVTLNTTNFGQTILVDTSTLSSNISITAPDPNGISDQTITFINDPAGTHNVTVTTPTGTFGNASTFNTIILYPGDRLKLMTLSALGYQCLNLSRASGLGNILSIHFPTAQVLTLGSVKQTLVSAPGVNSFILFKSGNARINATGNIPFLLGGQLALYSGTTVLLGLGAATFVRSTVDSMLPGFTATTGPTEPANIILNQSLTLGVTTNQDFTTGTGSLDFAIQYSIITFF